MKRIVLLIALVGLITGGFAAGGWKLPQWKIPQLTKTESSKELTVYGNVDVRQVDLAFRVGGRLAEVYFEEGGRLKTGDLVARLDPEPYEEAVAVSTAELARAAADLEKMRNGSRSQEVKSARAKLAEQQASLKTLEKEYQRRGQLVVEGAISRQSFDDVAGSRDEALARVNSAQESLNLLLEGYRSEDVKAAKAAYDSAAAHLEQARTQLADTKLIAPSEGTVLTRVREPGTVINAGASVMTLSIAAPVWVRAYLPEPQLGRIRPGMAAHVYTDSKPNEPIEGLIGFISPEAEFTPKNVETTELRTKLVYRFHVVVKDPQDRLRQGMPVTVKLNAEGESTPEAGVAEHPDTDGGRNDHF